MADVGRDFGPPTASGAGSTGFGLEGLSAGFDIIGGLAGLFSGLAAGRAADSRARLLQLEADVDAQRFQEQADAFVATQKLAFLKGGIEISGSPLDVLDESIRVSSENISAIRSRGRFENERRLLAAEGLVKKGRRALVSGLKGATKTLTDAAIFQGRTTGLSFENRRNVEQ